MGLFGKLIGQTPLGAGARAFLNLINSLPPASANDGTVLPAVQTYDAVGRIVLGQTNDAGQSGKYVRIRASAGGTILAAATTSTDPTSLTNINRGSGDTETYAIEIEAWLELVVTAATVSMLSSATVNDIGADNTANVFARFATPTSAAEAATQRAYVFETDDPSLTFYEATPQTVYGAGTASCDGVVTFYNVSGGMPAFVYAGSTDTTADGIRGDGTSYTMYRGGEGKYIITTTAASPSLATGTWTETDGTAPAPTVLGVTYDVEVASRVQWPIQTAVLTADFPKTNDTLTAVTDLTLNLEAGHWYRVTGQWVMDNPNVPSELQFSGGTVTATGMDGATFITEGGATGSVQMSSLSASITGVTDFTYCTTAFTIQVNVGGTLIPAFRQSVSDATPNSLYKYSTIQAIDVTP